jgi:1,4-alpha-glucan branching enzyme
MKMKALFCAASALLACGGAAVMAKAPAEAPPVPARYQPQPFVKIKHPEWTKQAVLYQINLRQFTPDGTFHAAQAQLPRLKTLGVDIIWLMPIHPIGVKNRKGTLGSPYSVKDYLAVNPEFGTKADLKAFVEAAHAQGMKVILDWVANHTAWDNPIHAAHPEWYEKDWKGANRPTPWWDWSDIIDLNYAQPGLRQYMTNAMTYWVREFGIDGYRCDVAGYVPLDFWENVRSELDAIKPVFMLGEFDQRDIHARAFDASYAWKWNNAMHDIAMGKADVGALFGFYSELESAWPKAAQRMTYTENHDQNAWEGTEFERFGPALENAIVLSFIGEGMPLIHNGQEAGNTKRLKFFDKDPIIWESHPNEALFKKLITFRDAHSALWNAPWGGTMTPVVNSAPGKVLSFTRANGGDKVFALFKMSGTEQTIRFTDGPVLGTYRDYNSGQSVTIGPDSSITLAPWSHTILSSVSK